MGRVLRFALVAGSVFSGAGAVVLGALPLAACHEEFSIPVAQDLAKQPENFGFDLSVSDLSGTEANHDLSGLMVDIAHPDLRPDPDAG